MRLRGGGKGALVYEDVSHTITTTVSLMYVFHEAEKEPPVKSGSLDSYPRE